MVDEEARSKAEEQPWKNICAENGRDICRDNFPTGSASGWNRGIMLPAKMAMR